MILKNLYKRMILLIICGGIMVGLFGCSLMKKEYVVGIDIKKEDITEFYDTYATTTNPQVYRRYYFYKEDNQYYFYYKMGTGENFTYTSEDSMISDTIELTKEEWDTFYSYLEGSTVRKREKSLNDGESGPWFYLYWKNDKGKIQELHFNSYKKMRSFEEYSASLIKR